MKFLTKVGMSAQQAMQSTALRVMLASSSAVGMILASGAGTHWM
ncbi:MAG: hypothetical protein ACRDG4_19280 [Chloroflexota bacterium]